MRKVNAIISMGIIVLFLVHGIAGSFQMMGIISGGSTFLAILTWCMVAMISVHTVIGIILTIHTLCISKKTGVSYIKENSLFWIRRISGFVLILLVSIHLAVFMQTGENVFRLNYFGISELAGQILMLATLAVHLLCNIKPLSIALGLYGESEYIRDILLILSAVLVFCAVAFSIYYLRWNVLWR
jgi:succinate dehydrogenase hydrophobic anchor subunit